MKRYVGFGRIPKSGYITEYWVGTKPFIAGFMPESQLHVVAMANMPSHDGIRDKIDLIEVYELPEHPVVRKTMAEWDAESK